MAMESIQLCVFAFFTLSVLCLITLLKAWCTTCKFSKFLPEAKVAKVMYLFIWLLCLARVACFGVVTGAVCDQYEDREAIESFATAFKNETRGLLGDGHNHKSGPSSKPAKAWVDYTAERSPMFMVLLVLTPESLLIYAYLNLVFQMYAFYLVGHLDLIPSLICKNKGKCTLMLGILALLGFQIFATIMYVFGDLHV